MGTYSGAVKAPARVLDAKEQADLLRVTGLRKDGFRDHVIFSIALGTGLRSTRSWRLNVGQVFTPAGRARRRLVLQVFKRSNRDVSMQEVLTPDTLRAKLEKLLAWKRSEGQPVEANAPLFLSRNGDRLSPRQLRELFAKWQREAGFDRRFSFHALRHTACTNLYRGTRDIRVTQRFARHKSVTSTAIYTHPTDEDMARAVAQLPC